MNEVPLMAKAGYAFSFLSTIAFRPFAAGFWGWVGDKYGRTIPLYVTPLSVAVCCLLATLLPSYQSAGDFSIILLFLLRATQGFFWVGEKTAANIYITEIVPLRRAGLWSCIACVGESLGSFFALGVISLTLYFFTDDGWRIPFYIGGVVAFLSLFFRRYVKESSEFLRHKIETKRHRAEDFIGKHVKNLWRFFAFELLFGAGFFFVYIYCGEVLKRDCGLTGQEVALHNLIMTVIQGIIIMGYGVASLRYDGLRMVQYRVAIYLISIPYIFYLFQSGEQTEFNVYVVQTLVCLLGMDHIPCLPFLVKKIPVLIRMRAFAFACAIGKLLMYLITTYVIASWIEVYLATSNTL